MNTLPATLTVDAGEAWADTGAGRFRLPAFAVRLDEGAPLVVGVRPEDLHRESGPVTGTVRAVEWLGPERHVLCDVAGTLVTIREPAEKRDPTAGETVLLGCEQADVHVFDAHTTERVM